MKQDPDPRFEAELRRGVVQLVALQFLETPRYGYDLVRLLGAAGFSVEEGTLYPILRRFEKQGVLTATGARAVLRARAGDPPAARGTPCSGPMHQTSRGLPSRHAVIVPMGPTISGPRRPSRSAPAATFRACPP